MRTHIRGLYKFPLKWLGTHEFLSYYVICFNLPLLLSPPECNFCPRILNAS